MSDTRRIAVLGSNSFSGSHLIDLLLEDASNEVLGISRSCEKSGTFLPYKRHEGYRFRFQRLDLNRDSEAVIKTLDSFHPEYIVNFAAQSEVAPSWEHPEHWFTTNTVALARLTTALRERAYLRRYVHISSPEVYGSCKGRIAEDAPMNPSTPYAASKAAADLLLATFVRNVRFPLVTIRATNVYGPGQQLWKIIPRTVVYLKLNKTIELEGGGSAIRSYIHVRDVSRGESAAMLRGRDGQIYHLSPDNGGYSVRAVVQRICEAMGRDFATSVRFAGERRGQDAVYVIDSGRAREELGWRPAIGLDDGLQEVIRWVEDRWDEVRRESFEYVHRA